MANSHISTFKHIIISCCQCEVIWGQSSTAAPRCSGILSCVFTPSTTVKRPRSEAGGPAPRRPAPDQRSPTVFTGLRACVPLTSEDPLKFKVAAGEWRREATTGSPLVFCRLVSADLFHTDCSFIQTSSQVRQRSSVSACHRRLCWPSVASVKAGLWLWARLTGQLPLHELQRLN